MQVLRHGYFAGCRQNSANVRRSSVTSRRLLQVSNPLADTSPLQTQARPAVEPIKRQDTDDLFPWLSDHKTSSPTLPTQTVTASASQKPVPGFINTFHEVTLNIILSLVAKCGIYRLDNSVSFIKKSVLRTFAASAV